MLSKGHLHVMALAASRVIWANVDQRFDAEIRTQSMAQITRVDLRLVVQSAKHWELTGY